MKQGSLSFSSLCFKQPTIALDGLDAMHCHMEWVSLGNLKSSTAHNAIAVYDSTWHFEA